jgi:hypothetical protein
MLRVAEVEWWDAVGPLDLEDDQDLLPPLAMTVGYVLRESGTHVVLAAEVFEGDQHYRACTAIPKCSIKAFNYLT